MSKGSSNLALAGFFAEAAVFYGLVSTVFRPRPWCVHLTTLMASGAVWQLLTYRGVSTAAYLLAFASGGLLLLLSYRWSLLEHTAVASLANATFQAANTLLSLSFVSSTFYSLTRISSDAHWIQTVASWSWSIVGFCATMCVCSLLAVRLVQQAAWRRWYVVTTIDNGAVTLLALHQLIDLRPWPQREVFTVIIGLFLLMVGYHGWYREQERESDVVSMSLLCGSLLASVPRAIAT